MTVAALICAAGFVEIAPGACAALPRTPRPDTPAILYLHGMYRPDDASREMAIEERIGRAATNRGFAVLAPRGRPGLCDWSPSVASFLCWPTRDAHAREAERIASAIETQLAALNRRSGSRAPPLLFGFSNGGFFAAFLATEGRIPLRALAVVNGGGFGRVDWARAVPTLLVGAKEDRYLGPLMQKLHERLGEAGWPHEYRVRDGGHALTERDVDDTLEFFARSIE